MINNKSKYRGTLDVKQISEPDIVGSYSQFKTSKSTVYVDLYHISLCYHYPDNQYSNDLQIIESMTLTCMSVMAVFVIS